MRQAVLVDSRPLLVNFDDPPPVEERWWALATGRLIDEETGEPANAPTLGRTSRQEVSVTARGDGTFALVARPWLAFPPLLSPIYGVSVTIEVAGYLPVDLTISVPSQQRQIIAPAPAGSSVLALNDVTNLAAGQLLALGPAAFEERARIRHLGPGVQELTLEVGVHLPHGVGAPVVAWVPVDLGDVALRRAPVVIRGRAVRRDSANQVIAVPDATISLTDFWASLAAVRAQLPGAMTDPNPAARAFVLSVSPGLVVGRDVGPGQVAEQTLTPVANDDRLLIRAVAAGDTALRVSSRQLIAAGSTLRLDPDQPDIAETVLVTDVVGFGPPGDPGDVTVALPLRARHAGGARIARLVPQPPGAAVVLRRDARASDEVVFVADLATLPDGADVRLTGGVPVAEYQRIRRIQAQSHPDGYFSLPPLHRVAALQLHVTAPSMAPVEINVQVNPNYAQREQWLDAVFP